MTIHAGTSSEAVIQTMEKQGNVTPEGARKFIEAAETKLLDLWIRSSRAQWVHQTFITHDTEILAAQADQVVKSTTANLAAESKRYEHLKLPEDVRRAKDLSAQALRRYPAPRDPAEQASSRRSLPSRERLRESGSGVPDGAQGKCPRSMTWKT